MTLQLLKKEFFVTSMAYVQSLEPLLPQKEYEMLNKTCTSQAFLNVIEKIVEVYGEYLTEDQLLFLLNNFKESKPIINTLLANMPAIVETMTEAMDTLQQDLHFIGEEYAAE